MANLRILRLHGTKITAAGIAELKAALPKCAIFWDGGAVIPGATSPLPASAATAAANPKSQIENPKSAATGSYALEFNGKDSYVDLPTVPLRRLAPDHAGTTIVPYKNLEGGDVIGNLRGRGFAVHLTAASTQCLAISLSKSWANNTRSQGPSVRWRQNRRLHMAGVLEGSTIRLFIEGKQHVEGRLNRIHQSSDDPFIIGCASTHQPGRSALSLFGLSTKFASPRSPATRPISHH